MATFTDNKGRTWELALSIDACKRVRTRCSVDLLAKNLPAVLQAVLGDYVTLGDVLFVIVEPEAKAKGVEPEDFGRSLAGDCIEAASYALLDSLRDFTPNQRDRDRLAKVLEAAKAAAEAFRDQADEAVNRGTAEMLQALRTGAPSSNLPASPASTPAP